MVIFRRYIYALLGAVMVLLFAAPHGAEALTIDTATTSLYLSICGDAIVNDGEDCDVPGETGEYSTSIAGRQCSETCQFGPYCGDNILQTIHDEECDDGNNTSDDFCSAICEIEPSGGGGGGSSGSGGGSSGGSDEELGETQISINGRAYPNSSVSIIQDGSVVGTVRADSRANFSYSRAISPGAVSFGFWSTDENNVRSITFNTTFDVIQGAVTTVNGIFIPPTISIVDNTVNRGDTLTIRGQSVPDADIFVHINSSPETVVTTRSDGRGSWSLPFDTSSLANDSYTAKARFEFLSGIARRESTFSQVLTFFVGVSPDSVVTSADLNRDGRVNLTDFSILVFWWGTDGGNSNPPADINNNNRVGLEDFSILLFNWTG